MKLFFRLFIIGASLMVFNQQAKSQGQGIIDLSYKNGVVAADGKSWTFDIYGAGEASYAAPNNNWQAMNIRLDLTLPGGVTIVNSTGGVATESENGGNSQYASTTVGVASVVPGPKPVGTVSVGITLSRTSQTELTTTPVLLATVTVYFSGGTVSNSDFANQRTPATAVGSSWTNTIAADGRRAFGPVTQISLPVTYKSFTAVASGCAANLAWVTATEQNSKTYAIEFGTDGKTFTTVGTVASKNSALGNSYTFSYDNLGAATGYFRIKAVDYDATFAYSPIISVTGNGGCSVGMLIKVSPNPTTNLVNIQGLVTGSHISVLDAGGKTLSEVVASGTNQAIYLSTYSSGVYTLKIQKADGSITNVKVVKQ